MSGTVKLKHRTQLTALFAQQLGEVFDKLALASNALEEIRPGGGFSELVEDGKSYFSLAMELKSDNEYYKELLKTIMTELKVDSHSEIMPVIKFLMRCKDD